MSKDDLWALVGCFGVLLIGSIIYFMLPDREIRDDRYLELAWAVELCPDAYSALAAINKDHKILGSEANKLEVIIKDYVKQNERSTKAYNIQVAKGVIKGPLRKRTCVPVPAEPGKK